MGENTKIEWADHTMNFWIGCEAISPGCLHCYAEAYAKRVGRDFAKRTRTSANNWNQPFKWNRAAEKMNRRFRVFTNSLADFFDNEVPAEWRADALGLMLACDRLDWLVLTKRIGNAQRMLDSAMAQISDDAARVGIRANDRLPQTWDGRYSNIWIGATVVNQEEADRDIPKLLQVDASVRFLSIEPLLGPIQFDPDELGLWCEDCQDFHGSDLRQHCTQQGIEWVIAGGESGHHARPMHPDWMRSMRDQCNAANVPFLFKQWGEWVTEDQAPDDITLPGQSRAAWASIDDDGEIVGDQTQVWKVGKKAAGRMLDGRTHDDFPVQP